MKRKPGHLEGRKRNLRTIPQRVLAELRSLPRTVVAGCARTFTADELELGALKHLKVSVRDRILVLPDGGVIVPPSKSGKYSTRNRDGYEVVRKDLPKELFFVTVESPNWGDASTYGTHDVDLPHHRYPRDAYPPRLSVVRVRALNARRGLKNYTLVFEVDEALDQKSRSFKGRLLELLNLLQENTGTCGIQKSDASLSDYLGALRLGWDILPPGTKDETLARIFAGRKPTRAEKQTAGERYDFFQKLNPQKHVFGTSGFNRYFGALIRTDLVVFENLAYGNAVYVMFRNWKKLSRMNRIDLMRGRAGKDFERVVHAAGWEAEVSRIVAERVTTAKA
jgi:hypothetical protein